jgi:hypothetical protein
MERATGTGFSFPSMENMVEFPKRDCNLSEQKERIRPQRRIDRTGDGNAGLRGRQADWQAESLCSLIFMKIA